MTLRSNDTDIKAAELVSGLGAVVLGAGIALIAPDVLRVLAVPVLLIGILVHGIGMTLKMRLEKRDRPPAWWERALFWVCWACLAALVGWVAIRWR